MEVRARCTTDADAAVPEDAHADSVELSLTIAEGNCGLRFALRLDARACQETDSSRGAAASLLAAREVGVDENLEHI